MLPPLSTRKAVLFCALAVLTSIQTTAQNLSLQGSEYSLVGAVAGDQVSPSVSVGSSGGMVAWEGAGSERGISAVRLDGEFHATGDIIRVNELVVPTRRVKPLVGDRERPQLVPLKDGGYLFAWEIRRGPNQGLYTRVLGTNGLFLSGDVKITAASWTEKLRRTNNWYGCYRDRWKSRRFKFREVIAHVRENAGGISMVPLPDGGALVAYGMNRSVETNTWTLLRKERWTGRRYSTNDVLVPVRYLGDWMQEVFVQRLDAAGNRVGEAIQINQQSEYNQRNPSLAAMDNGDFVVTWVSESPRGNGSDWTSWTNNFRVDVIGRVLDAGANPKGNEFMIGDSDGVNQANPCTVGMPGGRFAVLWSQQEAPLSNYWDVRGRVFSSDGTPSGASFVVNVHTDGNQYAPQVVSNGDNQVVLWTSTRQDGSREGVYGRLLVGGSPGGEELRINTTTINRQIQPVGASDGTERILGVWSSFVGESGFDLQAQRLTVGAPSPAVSSH